jgi:hypothetical protein
VWGWGAAACAEGGPGELESEGNTHSGVVRACCGLEPRCDEVNLAAAALGALELELGAHLGGGAGGEVKQRRRRARCSATVLEHVKLPRLNHARLDDAQQARQAHLHRQPAIHPPPATGRHQPPASESASQESWAW